MTNAVKYLHFIWRVNDEVHTCWRTKERHSSIHVMACAFAACALAFNSTINYISHSTPPHCHCSSSHFKCIECARLHFREFNLNTQFINSYSREWSQRNEKKRKSNSKLFPVEAHLDSPVFLFLATGSFLCVSRRRRRRCRWHGASAHAQRLATDACDTQVISFIFICFGPESRVSFKIFILFSALSLEVCECVFFFFFFARVWNNAHTSYTYSAGSLRTRCLERCVTGQNNHIISILWGDAPTTQPRLSARLDRSPEQKNE